MAIRKLSRTGKPKSVLFTLLLSGILLAPLGSNGQTRQSPEFLRQFSDSLEDLSRKVSPAVVQILVTGYGLMGKDGHSETAMIGRQRVTGSGAIIDPQGYIITNAHVVSGAQKVQVLLTTQTPTGSPAAVMTSASRSLEAKILGVDKQIDLALLKVEATKLPTLSFADYQHVRQGEVVLAFGSPEGLENTITMGVISSVARQAVSDRPLIYIQTDAPINPGNSGGPLVDVDGKVVGINTFILTQGGGSEGLGFAIPSNVVSHVYKQLKQYGHVHRKVMGVSVQSITPGLADALSLALDHGIVVSDILPGGPAESAGLQIQDIILSVNDKPMQSLPQFDSFLFLQASGDKVNIEVLRGKDKKTLEISVMERREDEDRLADLVNAEKNMIPQLGILGVSLDEKIAAMLESPRFNTGVIVAALTVSGGAQEIGLETGDVIHSINGVPIQNLETLRRALDKIKPGSTIALQVERENQLQYVEFEL
jgi:serine protease Do